MSFDEIDAWMRAEEVANAERQRKLAEIRQAIRAHADTLRQLHADARAALAHAHCDGHDCPNVGACDDLRPALRRLLRGAAEVHGRTVAEQIAAFAAEGDETFASMALHAWGVDPCS